MADSKPKIEVDEHGFLWPEDLAKTSGLLPYAYMHNHRRVEKCGPTCPVSKAGGRRA